MPRRGILGRSGQLAPFAPDSRQSARPWPATTLQREAGSMAQTRRSQGPLDRTPFHASPAAGLGADHRIDFSTLPTIAPADAPMARQRRTNTSTVGDFCPSSSRLTYWRDTPALNASSSWVRCASSLALRISSPNMVGEAYRIDDGESSNYSWKRVVGSNEPRFREPQRDVPLAGT